MKTLYKIDVNGRPLEILDCGREWHCTLISVAKATHVPHAKFRAAITKHFAVWNPKDAVVDRTGDAEKEVVLPLKWLDALLWSLPMSGTALTLFRREWRNAYEAWIKQHGDTTALITKVLAHRDENARLRIELQEANRALAKAEKVEQDFRAQNDAAASRALVMQRKSRPPIFTEQDYADIRASHIGMSDAEVAGKYGCHAATVAKIRAGRYHAPAFRKWMNDLGLKPAAAPDDHCQRKADKAWHPEPPDWVVALALACDQSSITAVAGELGVSRTAVSLILACEYAAKPDRICARVRELLMSDRPIDPV